MKQFAVSVLFAVIAFVLAASRINHGLVDSSLPAGPGLTLDESFNIIQGMYVFEEFLHRGPLFFTPSSAKEVFGNRNYLADHPPLARCLLAAFHEMTAWAIGGADQSIYNIPAARLGSCFALAMTVLLLMEFTRRRYGMGTAVASAIALLLMPRVIGHARLAAQETTTTLAWLAAVIPLLSWWTSEKPPTVKQCLISGLLFGLLLSTKIQGILLPPVIIVWSLWSFRKKAIGPLAIWGLVGCAVFFVLWPWLWLDPINHIRQYVLKTADRPTLYVWYLGQRYADKAVPFHYPFVMLLSTTPFAVTAAVAYRMIAKACPSLDRIERLAIATILCPLCVFALPGTPVYDSVRLFLIVMPMVAMLAGRGLLMLASNFGREESEANDKDVPRKRWPAHWLFFAMIPITLRSSANLISPFCLEEYSMNVGGPSVAVRAIGLEASYWSEGLNGDFWRQVPVNSTVYVAPVSHPLQLQHIQQLVPIVNARHIKLEPFYYQPTEQKGLMLFLHRLADLPPGLREVPEGAKLIAEARYRGVVMARLIDTTDANWQSYEDWPGEQNSK